MVQARHVRNAEARHVSQRACARLVWYGEVAIVLGKKEIKMVVRCVW